MRRRRRSDPAIFKFMGVGVLFTAAMLPIMAYLGVFKVVEKQYMEMTLMTLPPPAPEARQVAKKPNKAKPHVAGHHGPQIARSNVPAKPLPVHVAAATGPSAGNQDNSIENGTNTNIGSVPTGPSTTPTAPPPGTTQPAAAPPPAPVQPAAAPPAPPPATVEPTVTDPQVVYDPKPTLPQDLLDSDMDTTFKALFTIHPDGTTDVSTLQSTGNNELDQLALAAAKEWKFKPALKDGVPVASYERLYVEFQVS